MEELKEKLCPSCNLVKMKSEFYASKARKDGLSSWCRSCDRSNKQKAVESGLCVQCRKPTERSGKTLCLDCQAKRTQSCKLRKSNLRESGICVHCGQNPALQPLIKTQNAVCEICYLKQMAANTMKKISLWQTLRDKLIQQNYQCAYTGRKLILGKNASVDHILPQQRFPELISTPDNFQWVDLTVNQVKRNLTNTEFLNLIREIYSHCNV